MKKTFYCISKAGYLGFPLLFLPFIFCAQTVAKNRLQFNTPPFTIKEPTVIPTSLVIPAKAGISY